MYTLCVQLHNSSAVTLITLHFHEHYKREYTAIVICYSVPLMCFIISPVTAAVSDERRCSAHLFLVEVPAHHSAPSSSALAEGFRADCIQTVSPRVQVSTRVRTCIPYWRALSGGRCRGSSATPFQFIFYWLSAAHDSLPSVTELSRSPLHESGTLCQILSLP